MRDILNDLESGKLLSDPDPVRRAQNQMRAALPKRFYERASVEKREGGFEPRLDGKPVRTPGRAALALPTAAAAQLVADEFEAQKDVIDPTSMPVLRLANTVIDGVAPDPQPVLKDILRFASSDLVCYRAEGPEALVERQAQAWDPVVDWARSAMGARLYLAEGVMHVAQPPEAIAAIGAHMAARREPFRLAAMHLVTSLTGSALIAMAVEAGALEADDAWRAAHVDEDWNISQWGEDAEANARRALRERDFRGAVALLGALDRS